MKRWKSSVCLLLITMMALLNLSTAGVRADDFWGPWPQGDSPKQVGQLLLQNYLKQIAKAQAAAQNQTPPATAVPKRIG
ncbi:MAG TPA: hypothetical protein VKJ65_10555, partial [Phycisphaerae bacterium]|nr:hypothetical protein [Phycisphaerae bacterium]